MRSRDLQILAHAGAVFTADARVSAASGPAPPPAPGSRHTLLIERLRLSDAGRYECQVNTEPKMSLFFNLTVLGQLLCSVLLYLPNNFNKQSQPMLADLLFEPILLVPLLYTQLYNTIHYRVHIGTDVMILS